MTDVQAIRDSLSEHEESTSTQYCMVDCVVIIRQSYFCRSKVNFERGGSNDIPQIDSSSFFSSALMMVCSPSSRTADAVSIARNLQLKV